jgi:hypothetical protein
MSGVTHLADARFARAIEQLHRLGSRALYERLNELGARYLLRTEIEEAVARYVGINHDTLVAVGGDQLLAPPMQLIADRLDAALGHFRNAESGIEDAAALHYLDMLGVAIEDARDLASGRCAS